MTDTIYVTLCLDDAGAPRVEELVHQVVGGTPYIFIHIGGLSLWAHEPVVFRNLASALMAAADMLVSECERKQSAVAR